MFRHESGAEPQPQPQPEPQPEPDFEATVTEIESQLLDRIRSRAAVLLPGVARRLGLPESIVRCAHEIFDSMLAHTGADRNYDRDTALEYGYEWPAYDHSELRHDAAEQQADEFLTRLEQIFDEAKAAQPAAEGVTTQ